MHVTKTQDVRCSLTDGQIRKLPHGAGLLSYHRVSDGDTDGSHAGRKCVLLKWILPLEDLPRPQLALLSLWAASSVLVLQQLGPGSACTSGLTSPPPAPSVFICAGLLTSEVRRLFLLRVKPAARELKSLHFVYIHLSSHWINANKTSGRVLSD